MKKLALIILGLLLINCSKGGRPDAPSGEWVGTMHGFAQSFLDLYPLVTNKSEFEAKKNSDFIQTKMESLVKMSHNMASTGLQSQVAAKDPDPVIKHLASSLKTEITQALDSFEKGNKDFARVSLKNALDTCIHCHTRGQWGPEFKNWPAKDWAPNLKPLERAQVYTAVRNFDEALEIYLKALSGAKEDSTRNFEFEKAARGALNIAIRVKQDPEAAIQVINAVVASPRASRFFVSEVQQWKTQILEWKKELGKSKPKPEKGLADAKAKLDKLKKHSLAVDPRNFLPTYMIASATLHDFLRTNVGGVEKAEALLLLGQVYEVIQDPGERARNLIYYKTCIFERPHSVVAEECFAKYEENIFTNHLQDGFNLPKSSMDQLDFLQNMASTKSK